MSKQAVSLKKLDKRYISSLLQSLEERKKKGSVDQDLYERLKEEYNAAYMQASNKEFLREGFVTLEAIAPNPDIIRDSVKQLLKRIQDLKKERKNVEGRFDKLDELLSQGKISENVYHSKQSEYKVLLGKFDDQEEVYLQAIPDSLGIIREMNAGVLERLEELEVEMITESKSSAEQEKKWLTKIKKEIESAAKDLSKLVKSDYQEEDWLKPSTRSPPAAITPLTREMPQETATTRRREEPIRPPPKTNVWAKWKNITIGKLIGEVNLVGGNYAVVATDRPSLAIIRDIAVTGPSRLKSSTNPKVIEDRLKSLIKDAYGVSEDKALLPENMVKFAFDNKIGVDLFRLINSYYASVGKGAVKFQGNEAIVDNNAQILTLAENVNLLGRRVLAPDRNLIGVIHELYFDPITSNLYAFSFKGVPPQIIRRIYHDAHNRNMTDSTFGEFRNEISKKLSIPIYEALTPSSIIRYALLSGLLSNMNQLVTLVESMNPRITRASDISSINNQGILLSRFPQNALPKIEYFDY